jgi:hypothetical protein
MVIATLCLVAAAFIGVFAYGPEFSRMARSLGRLIRAGRRPKPPH